MPFASFKEIADSIDEGKYSYSIYRKLNTAASYGMIDWACDMSMSSGNIPANFCASSPLVSALVDERYSMHYGPRNVSPCTRHVARINMIDYSTTHPIGFLLCDYLMYYPFIDMTDGYCEFVNTVTLPRHVTGEGVGAFTVNQGTGDNVSMYYTISYTNSAGVPGRTSKRTVHNPICPTGVSWVRRGTDASNCPGLIGLQSGDTGIRSVQSITFETNTINGVLAIVLVKPICYAYKYESGSPAETCFCVDAPSMPRIYDDSVLSGLLFANSTAAGAVTLSLETIWR